MTTRSVILSRAFGRIGIAAYEFDVSPEERADARIMLDGMMAEWTACGVDLGYIPSDGSDNDGELIGSQPGADAAIWSNLAVRLAPEFGKTLSPELRRDAKRGYDLVLSSTADIPREKRSCRQINGGGDYYRRYYFR